MARIRRALPARLQHLDQRGADPGHATNWWKRLPRRSARPLLLPDGNVLYVGATGFTDLYSSSAGDLAGGPDLPYVLDVDSTDQGANTSNTYNTYVQAQCKDAPGALEVNGNVLVVAGATGGNYNTNQNGGYPAGLYFFEYTPDRERRARIVRLRSFPDRQPSSTHRPTTRRMIDLPNGQVLFTDGGSQLYAYTPVERPGLRLGSRRSTASASTRTPPTTSARDAVQRAVPGIGLRRRRLERHQLPAGAARPTATATSTTRARSTTARWAWRPAGTSVSTNFTAAVPGLPGTYNLSVVANGIASGPVSFARAFMWTRPMRAVRSSSARRCSPTAR